MAAFYYFRWICAVRWYHHTLTLWRSIFDLARIADCHCLVASDSATAATSSGPDRLLLPLVRNRQAHLIHNRPEEGCTVDFRPVVGSVGIIFLFHKNFSRKKLKRPEIFDDKKFEREFSLPRTESPILSCTVFVFDKIILEKLFKQKLKRPEILDEKK